MPDAPHLELDSAKPNPGGGDAGRQPPFWQQTLAAVSEWDLHRREAFCVCSGGRGETAVLRPAARERHPGSQSWAPPVYLRQHLPSR